jgi:hypothetical protein
MANDSAGLEEQWRDFLRQNPDARSVVDGIMDRTGFEEDEVIIYLLDAWVNSVSESQRESDRSVRSATIKH